MCENFLIIFYLVTSGLDFFLCYAVTNFLIGNSLKQIIKNFTYKEGLIAASYITLIIFTRFAEARELVASFVPLLVILFALLLFVTYIMKKNNSRTPIDEIALIFSIYYLISHLLVAVIIMPLILVSQNVQIIFLVIATICTVIFVLLLNRLNLNKLFVLISHRLALKMVISILSLCALIIFMYIALNYSYTTAPPFMIIPLGLLVVIISTGLMHCLKIAHQYEIVMPEKYDDMKKILTLLNIKAECVQTVEELKGIIDSSIELLGIKVAEPDAQPSENEPIDFKAFIIANINSLKLNHESQVEVITNIQFFEPHKLVNAMKINYMLGTLLENALETNTEYPILIDILYTEHVLLVKVANETPFKEAREIKNMFAKGYSTKGKVARGFGLSKLKKLVESHQGSVVTSQEMNSKYQVNYISITLNF